LPFTSKHICHPAQQKGTLMYNEQREIEYQSKQKEKKAQTSFSYLQNMTPPPPHKSLSRILNGIFSMSNPSKSSCQNFCIEPLLLVHMLCSGFATTALRLCRNCDARHSLIRRRSENQPKITNKFVTISNKI
jgi:hypothetical protein